MRSPRGLLSIGIGFLMVAGLSLLTGPSEFPWIYLAALLIGTALLVAGLVLSRREPEPSPELAPDPARGERLVRLAAATMAVLGIAALVVALLVPEGEAQAHAIGHLVTGLVCAGLFAALAFPWHPRPGTGTAMVRGIVLSLLAAAAIGGVRGVARRFGVRRRERRSSHRRAHDAAQRRDAARRPDDRGRADRARDRARRAGRLDRTPEPPRARLTG